MVLGGEDHILHAGSLGGFRPAFGIKMLGVERLVECPVFAFVVLVVGTVAVDPWFITDIPTLHDAPLRINAPVHHEPKLEVLPLADALHNRRLPLRNRIMLRTHIAH